MRDGLDTLSKQQTVVDAPTAKLLVTRGEIRFENVTFSYARIVAKISRRRNDGGRKTTTQSRFSRICR